MQALEIIKRHLGPKADALEVELFTAVKQRTLFNWFHSEPQKFNAIIIAAAELKRKLNLRDNELNSELIRIATQNFIESGGEITQCTPALDPSDFEPRAKPWEL